MSFFSSLFQRHRKPSRSLTKRTWGILTSISEPTVQSEFESLPEGEKQAFFAECYQLTKNETLQKVIEILIREQSRHILQSVERGADLIAVRSSILGIQRVWERIVAYANRRDEKELFNPNEPV